MLSKLIELSQNGIFDYTLLMSCLQQYKAPHRKITELLRTGKIVRIKKGLYILGKAYQTEPISRELLANLIYGPSYLSDLYALQFYGFIPERVLTVTSMTCKRKKHYGTPLGEFSYGYINEQRFSVGVDWVPIRDNIFVLMASPEKALVDTIAKEKTIITIDDMLAHLVENLRIDEIQLAAIDLKRMTEIEVVYNKPVVALLNKTLETSYGTKHT